MRALHVYVLSTLFQIGGLHNGDPCCDDKKRNPHRKLQHKPCHAGLYVIMSICLPCKLFADLELGLGNNGI